MPHLSIKAAAALGTLGLVAGAAQAQLTNGTLDATSVSTQVLATPTGWDITASRTVTGPFNDGASSEPWSGPAPTPVTPNDHGVFFKPFQGSQSTGDLLTVNMSQSVPAAPGETWFMSGWAGAEAGYSGLIPGGPTRTFFHLDFLNSVGSIISSVSLDLAANSLGVPNGQAFNYRQYNLNGVAPAGTEFAQARVSMVDAFGTSGGQAFVVDDFTLVIPEPTGLAVLGLGAAGLVARRRRA
jgi:hypothetical protein